MTKDDLRTRIAQTIYRDGDHILWPRCLELADLIIWELGLRQEWATTESLMLGTIKLQRPHDAVAVRTGSPWQHLEPVAPPYCRRCGIPHTHPCRRPNNL